MTLEDLVDCSRDLCRIELSAESKERILKARQFLEKIADEHKSEFSGISICFKIFVFSCVWHHNWIWHVFQR